MNDSSGNQAGTTPPAEVAVMNYVMEPLGLRIVRLALYVIIFVIATVGNSLVIFVVYKTRELHTVTGYLIANLAVADFGVGLLCIPFTVVVYELDFYWPFGSVLCKIIPSLMPFFLMGSVGTMLAISIDRHQSIVYPFGARITRHQSKLLMTLIWLIALFPALPLLPVMRVDYIPGSNTVACLEYWPPLKSSKMNFSQLYTACTFVLTYFIPLPIMTLLYVRIGLKLRDAIREAADRPGFTQAQKTKRIIKMLAAVVACYALCFLPFHTLYFMIEIAKYQSRYTHLLHSYFQVLMYFNSATNPLLYAFMGDQFKAGFKQVVMCQTAAYDVNRTSHLSTIRNVSYTKYTPLLHSYFLVLMYFNSATNPLLYAFLGDQFKTGFKRAIGKGKNTRRNMTFSTRRTTASYC